MIDRDMRRDYDRSDELPLKWFTTSFVRVFAGLRDKLSVFRDVISALPEDESERQRISDLLQKMESLQLDGNRILESVEKSRSKRDTQNVLHLTSKLLNEVSELSKRCRQRLSPELGPVAK
jgi:hypothetical protein